MEGELAEVYQNLLSLPYTEWVLAYSGGVDSGVLLDLIGKITKVRKDLKVTVVHVNHGVNPNADHWVTFCRQEALKRNLTYVVEYLPKFQGKNLENRWREERYRRLAKYLNSKSCLLTAHHAFDQTESYFLHLLRGCGLWGLRGISLKVETFEGSYIFRPMLKVSKKEILNYAQKEGLLWVEDTSNQDLYYQRNFLRFFLPFLEIKWPKWWKTINKVTENLQETAQLLEEYLEADLKKRLVENRLDCLNLSTIKIKELCSYWLMKKHNIKLTRLQRGNLVKMLNAKRDAQPSMELGENSLYRYHNYLYLSNNVRQGGEIYLKNLELYFPKAKLTDFYVDFYRGGEKIKLFRRGKTHKLKKLLQEREIPPFQRPNIPLIFYQKELVAIVGMEANEIINRYSFLQCPEWKILVDKG